MEPTLAGIYFKEDIFEGTSKALLISLICYAPLLLLILKKDWFVRTVDTLQVLLTLYIVAFSFLLVPMCPHYWELAFPIFSGIAAAVLFAVRRRKNKSIKKSVYACTAINILFGALAAYPTFTDISDALSGEKRSREEFLKRMDEAVEMANDLNINLEDAPSGIQNTHIKTDANKTGDDNSE